MPDATKQPLDLKSTVIRVIRFFLKLVSERRFGRIEITLQGGTPGLVRFEEQMKPAELPQVSGEAEHGLIGQSVTELVK